jgi:DNA-directed RNA polymerase III subunit RPC11
LVTIARIKKIDEDDIQKNAFQCRTCPYQHVLTKPYPHFTKLKKKEVDDIIGEKDQWESAQKVQGRRLTVMQTIMLMGDSAMRKGKL